MSNDYYFSDNAISTTWERFTEAYARKTVENSFEKITGYGWKDNFAFNPNGEAIYIDSHGIKYSGIWFNMNDGRIAIFKK